jgi:hypothetical protein
MPKDTKFALILSNFGNGTDGAIYSQKLVILCHHLDRSAFGFVEENEIFGDV